ncbi:MAG: hypothetical protein ACE37D_21705 [Pseudomonadales bacterium]
MVRGLPTNLRGTPLTEVLEASITTAMEDSKKIVATLANLFKKENSLLEFEVLSLGKTTIESIGYDNWNGGTETLGIFCSVPLDTYSKIEDEIQTIELRIKEKTEKIFRAYPHHWIGEVVISPELSTEIVGKSYRITSKELLRLLELQKGRMISVSTGGPKIQSVNSEYVADYEAISIGLEERDIDNPNPFEDLWGWYGKWSDGSLPKYQHRRDFISNLFEETLALVKKSSTNDTKPIFEEPTGWARVDRSLGEIKLRLVQASTEEQFQAVGLLCRETLISLAQVVFDQDIHKTLDKVSASKTDAKRMLEAYISHVLAGSTNENTRKHAKASLALANDLTHRRTAEFRIAALCAEATNSLVNIISIISGRRDPK